MIRQPAQQGSSQLFTAEHLWTMGKVQIGDYDERLPRQEALFECHLRGFAYLGVPRRKRYDNLKPSVHKILTGKTARNKPPGSPSDHIFSGVIYFGFERIGLPVE